MTKRAAAKTKSVGGQELTAEHFAYVGDPKDIETWKLPIHDKEHAQNAMARFNQTEGIPESEKKAVAKKIAAKAKSFGIDVTEFEKEYCRSANPLVERLIRSLPAREIRTMAGRIELRQGDKGPCIRMHIPYNSESDDLGGFREVVRPGAFTKTMNEQDIMALWNHDPNWVLGRTGNRMLTLQDGQDGLTGEVQLDPENPMHMSFARSVERRDVTGTSFGFEKKRDNWEGMASDGMPLRSLLEARLYDVSPVTFPAYPESSAEKRSSVFEIASVQAGVDLAALAAALAATEDGRVAADAAAAVRSAVDRIVAMLPAPAAPQRSDEDRRRILRMAERIAGKAAA